MGIASYEARSDPESLRMERTEKDHTSSSPRSYLQSTVWDMYILMNYLYNPYMFKEHIFRLFKQRARTEDNEQ
jgi:hypothetical protein